MTMFRTYTETYDMNTESGAPTILGIHTPIGKEPYNFLKPCFDMYRKFKYLGCDVTIVNSAHLPVSPEAYGIEAGLSNVDPRDTLDPVMFRGCHGDEMGAVLNSMYGGMTSNIFKLSGLDKEKSTILESFYYTALGDPSWRKSPIQKTLKINGLHPIVYQMATQMQIAPSGSDVGGYYENTMSTYGTKDGANGRVSSGVNSNHPAFVVNPAFIEDITTGTAKKLDPVSMFTNRCGPLGWLDTKQIIGNSSISNTDADNITCLPKIFMGILMLPPARLAYNFLRVIIRHKWVFRDYRTVTLGMINQPTNAIGYNNQYTGGTPSAKAISFEEDPRITTIREVLGNDES